MTTFPQLIKELELHDSTLRSLTVNWNGSVDLRIDIDFVWNKDVDPAIRGIRVCSVYEIAEFKIDRMNIIGEVEIVELAAYDKKFVLQENSEPGKTVMVSIEFVAGGRLCLICSDSVEYLK